MSEWIRYDDPRAKNRRVLDARGGQVDKVRSTRVEAGGVRVRVLGTINGGDLAVIGVAPEDETVSAEIVEFEAFIRGGRIE